MPPAHAYCGLEDKDIDSAKDFAVENSGSLALNFAGKYYVLRRDRCTKFSSINTRLHFYVNHINLTADSEKAFLAVHAALLNPSDLRNVIYLFRNAKASQRDWNEDGQSGEDYSSLHDVSHSQFNSDINNLSKNQFDSKYRNGSRKWNDSITNAESSYDTWSTKSNFLVRDDLINATTSGRGGLRVQDYLISFITGKSDRDEPLKYAPDFSMEAGGAKCILLRISGSGNISAIVTGEYVVALNGTETCDSTISQLRGIGFLEWIFGYRN